MTRKKKAILFPVFFMMGIAAVYTLVLALINEASIDRILALQEFRQKQTILYVLDQEVPADEAALNAAFDKLIQPENDYFVAKDGDQVLGYAFPIEGSGLWGRMTGYAAVDAAGTRLLGMDIPDHSETPGLGGRIEEPWFKEQFRQIPLNDSGKDFFIFRPATEGNVDAITGATQTSEAVRKLLIEDTERFVQQLKGESP